MRKLKGRKLNELKFKGVKIEGNKVVLFQEV